MDDAQGFSQDGRGIMGAAGQCHCLVLFEAQTHTVKDQAANTQ